MSRRVVAGAILGLVALSLILIAVNIRTEDNSPRQTGYTGTGGKVGVIYIEGTIASGQADSVLWGDSGGAETICAALRRAAKDPEIAAVVIRLNSSGGTPAAAQEIGMGVTGLQEAGKVVVASMGDMAASGAYWIAACTDQIVANPGTMTGSIGVIMQTANMQGLYDKLGIDTETFKSGPYKDMGSASRSVTAEERVIFQAMIDDIYEQFVEAVAEGRNKDVTEIRPLADGRIFTGRQALELGLIDHLGDFNDAILLAGEMAGISGEPSVVEISSKNTWWNLLNGSWGSIFSGQSQLPLVKETRLETFGLH